ncbi:hypothetical protein TNCV_4177131 [Trichonephila clavipes]|nr:hypothetical protein TNCV_4177131 [Trichonephila clavipes]
MYVAQQKLKVEYPCSIGMRSGDLTVRGELITVKGIVKFRLDKYLLFHISLRRNLQKRISSGVKRGQKKYCLRERLEVEKATEYSNTNQEKGSGWNEETTANFL